MIQKLFETSKIKTDVDTTKEDAVPLYAKDEEGAPIAEEANDEPSPVKSTPKKRKVIVEEKEEEAGPSKKKEKIEDEAEEKEEKCPDGETPCQYGKGCYRKNADHKKEFWHPKK